MENLDQKSDTQKKIAKQSKYNPELHLAIARICARAGYTDAETAKEFGVSRSTLSLWKNEHPEFLKVLTEAKKYSDDKVVASLYKRACGFDYLEEQVIKYRDSYEIVKVKKKVLPETIAAIFWLKNRQRDKWKDRWEIDGLGDALKDGIKVKIIDGN